MTGHVEREPSRTARAVRAGLGVSYHLQLTNTLMVRRALAGDALRFAEDLETCEDVECFVRLSRRGNAAYFDVETAQLASRPQAPFHLRWLLRLPDAWSRGALASYRRGHRIAPRWRGPTAD